MIKVTQKNIPLGHITNLELNMTEPKINIPSMAFNNIMLLVGKNGTGKTFILVTNWVLSYICMGKVIADMNKQVFDAEAFAQYVIDGSYDTAGVMDGYMRAEYTSGSDIRIDISAGKVTNVTINLVGVSMLQPVIFMSTGMRLFSAMDVYLSMRKALRKYIPGDAIPEMVKHYKLYDVIYIEGLIARMPIQVDQSLRDRWKSNFDIDDNITEFSYDINDCKFYVIKDGVRKNLCTYGNGHQSIFNMTIAAPS